MPMSGSEFAEAARHVAYEFRMLSTAALDYLGDPDPVRNILFLEGFLTHARNLLEFFVPRRCGPRATDIWAGLFVPDWDARRHEAIALEAWAHIQGIDKHLAHLTFARVEQPRPPWDIVAIGDVIIGLSKEFYLALSDERRPWFGELYGELLRHRVPPSP
jgi:hypothetical protein